MIIFFTVALLIVLLVIGVAVPACFGAAFLIFALGIGEDLNTLINVGYRQVNTVVLLSIPMFILAGGIIEKGKLGKALTDFIEIFMGKMKGGLGVATVVASAVFGAISGSASATLSCIGGIMAPKLKESHYNKGLYAALIANSAPLGLLIPPSSMQIMYAWVTGQSVLACFLATVIPGIILVILLSAVNIFYCSRDKEFLEYSSKMLEVSASEKKVSIGRRTFTALPALMFPVIVLGGIYAGIMTPTEAAAVSVVYAIPVGFFIYKGLTLKDFKDSLKSAGTTSGVVMLMLFMIMILSRLFVLEDLPNKMANALLGISDNKIVVLMMINVFMVIIGMLMDDSSGCLLCAPVLLPLIVGLGVSPVQFAAILGVNLGMGNITPPTAPLLYLASRTTGVPVKYILKPTLAMIVFAWLPTLIITTYVPQVSLFLPSLFGYV